MNFVYKAATVVGLMGSEDDVRGKYVQHMEEYGISFGTADEHEYRFNIFQKKHNEIENHNAGDYSFTMGHNKFSTWSVEEMESLLAKKANKTQPSTEEPKWVYKDAADQGIDWRKQGVVSIVKDQGQCGDPWMVTAVDEMSMAHSVRTGTNVQLSLQQMVDCYSTGHSCGSNRVEDPYAYIQKFGLTTEEEYPHTGRQEACKFHSGMKTVQVEKMNYLDQEGTHPIASGKLEDSLKEEPIVLMLDAQSIYFQAYTGGILDRADCGTDANHPVIAVGWGVSDAGKQFYIIKNTWGADWGEDGYIRIAATHGGFGICGINSIGVWPSTN